jgi:signal transduction histidine kinase/CheY-like chemotaxis protein
MRAFRDQPIARKALALGLVPTLCTLLMVVIASGTATFFTARRNAVRAVDAQAVIVADSVSAALAFKDTNSVTDTLDQLRTGANVSAACVFDANGVLFASYARDGHGCDATFAEQTRAGREPIVATRSITAGGRQLGVVAIAGNLSLFYQWIRIQAYIILGSLVGGTLIALFLTQLLQRAISQPVLDLATTANRVTSQRDYSLRATRTTDDEVGRLVQSFNAMLDEIQRQNEALTVEIAERKRAEYLKDQFLAAVSHELRTPLNAILGWLQILRTTEGGPERLERGLESLERNARSQTRVIEDLLDVSRMATGKLQVKMDVVDLRTILATAIDAARPTAIAKAIHLDLEMPSTTCLASADRDRLQQLASNLLSNAIKFTPPGGAVTVMLSSVGTEYVISVSDTGIGISRDFLPFVFDRFRQADGSMTRQFGGLGLGLAIVKEVTELHGGTVTARSEGEGRGSTFTIRLPQLVSVGRQRPSTKPSGRPGQLTGEPLAGVRVLAVDDDPDGLEIVKAVLTAAGANVQVVASGHAAIAAWTRDPCDVLLCDLAMPDMDGFQVLSCVNGLDVTSGRRTAAIALTAYTTDEYLKRCKAAGFHARVGKPFDTSELTDAIRAALAQIDTGPGGAPRPYSTGGQG